MPQILLISPENRLSTFEAWLKENFPGFEVKHLSKVPDDVSEATLIISDIPLRASEGLPPWILVNEQGISVKEARSVGASLVISPDGPWDKELIESLLDAPSIRGDLASFSLPDVLQLLAVKGGRHLIKIFSAEGQGRIYLEGEEAYFVEFLGEDELSGLDALKKILTLKSGYFEVRPPLLWPERPNINGPIQALLIEATRLEDEREETDLFFDFDELKSTSSSQQEDELSRIQEIFPEAGQIIFLDEAGNIIASKGEGDKDSLSGLVSYVSLNLAEIGENLALGDLKGFAIGGSESLWAAVKKGSKTVALKAFPRKGILRWSKKLLEV
ncbi:DUF4388 domain-containing protein [Thermosulfuriphilus sp.]